MLLRIEVDLDTPILWVVDNGLFNGGRIIGHKLCRQLCLIFEESSSLLSLKVRGKRVSKCLRQYSYRARSTRSL